MRHLCMMAKFAGFLILAAWSLLPAIALAVQTAKERAAEEQAALDSHFCELILGKHIENLTLVPLIQKGDSAPCLRRGSSMFAPPGRYWIEGIQLEGGLSSAMYSGYPAEQITLALGKPSRFDIRTPLTSSVTVRQAGRLLKLDYQLLDADGRKYQRNDRGGNDPARTPQFAIYQGGRQICSGAFEYG